MLVAPCIACRYGHHDLHDKFVSVPPEGVLGGHTCPCKGECQNKSEEVVAVADKTHADRSLDCIENAVHYNTIPQRTLTRDQWIQMAQVYAILAVADNRPFAPYPHA